MMLKLAVVLKGLVVVSSLAQFGSWLDVLISLFIQEVTFISSLDQGPSEIMNGRSLICSFWQQFFLSYFLVPISSLA